MKATGAEPAHVLPFGRHKGVPLAEVPNAYLQWAIRTVKLSSGLYSAVAAELRERGTFTPDPPEWVPPPCRRCGVAGIRCSWQVDSLGRRHVRAACASCGFFLAMAPARQPFTDLAKDPATKRDEPA
jgi:hypothetical protein